MAKKDRGPSFVSRGAAYFRALGPLRLALIAVCCVATLYTLRQLGACSARIGDLVRFSSFNHFSEAHWPCLQPCVVTLELLACNRKACASVLHALLLPCCSAHARAHAACCAAAIVHRELPKSCEPLLAQARGGSAVDARVGVSSVHCVYIMHA